MKRIPIVIDCDPGVDDSYAIALANSYPGFEIKAITPVAGNVVFAKTSRNALCLREMLGIDCRVGAGADRPLFKPYVREAAVTHGQSGVGTVVFPEPRLTFDEKPAWDVIYEEAVAANGELILFAVGPLTNIAKAVEKYPDLPKIIKKFVIMGGSATFGNVRADVPDGDNTRVERFAEFNIWIDPTAARIVFEKFTVYMIGLNATHAAEISFDDFDAMIAACGDNPKAYLVRELSKFSKQNVIDNATDSNIIHDALAVASVIDESIVGFEPYYVYVEDDMSKPNDGQTVTDLERKSGKEPNCYAAMAVDRDKFRKMMLDMCRYYGNL